MTIALEDLPAVTLPPAVLEGANVAGWILDDLAKLDLGDLTSEQIGDAVSSWHRVASRIDALKLRLLAAAEKAEVAAELGMAGTGAWFARQTRTSPSEAARDVALADALATDPGETGAALARGELTSQHAQVILRATDQLPSTLSDAQRAQVEAALVEQARRLDPQQLRRAARRALEVVEADVAKVDEHENSLVRDAEAVALAKTRLTLHDNGDGTVSGHFTVPELHGHLLGKILESMTAPRRAKLGAGEPQVGERGIRTDWDRARGQAFCELLEHLPTDRLHGKVAATVVVTVDEAVLRGALKTAGLDTGGSLSAGETRRLACGAGILPAVLVGASLPLDLGRTRRLFTEAQRIALGVAHKTCAADGCQRPFAWCELHHRKPWSLGGRTDLAQAVPLCWFHHRRIHDGAFVHRDLPDGSIRFHRRP
jgi:hypothetical protein